MRRADWRRSARLAALSLAIACARPPKVVPPELLDCSPPPAASARPIAWAPLAWAREPTPQCLAREEVTRYQHEVRLRIYERWRVPSSSPLGAKVQLRFSLAADGSIVGACLLHADDRALGESAVQALFRSEPFPPMREAVLCLAARRLVGTFSVER